MLKQKNRPLLRQLMQALGHIPQNQHGNLKWREVKYMNTPVIKKNTNTPWTPLAPGIEMQIFYANPASGIWTVKILMHAGSTLPPHRHIGASEFYILKGKGVHKESGSFEIGTYAFEPEGALHSPVHADQDIVLYMTSYGAGVFLKKSGETLYKGNAEYFKSQMELGALGRIMKHFFFITIWKIFNGKNTTSKQENLANAKQSGNFMIPTEHRLYHPIDDISGLGIKPMNALEKPFVWSATLRIESGKTIPLHENTHLCEFLVVRGTGHYEGGGEIAEGDYVREEKGQYPAITATSELVFFLTNHGQTAFFGSDEQVIWVASADEIQRLQETDENQ